MLSCGRFDMTLGDKAVWQNGKEDALISDRELVHISLEHTLQVQLLELPLQSRRQAGVHGGSSREHNVFVELRPGDRKAKRR